jgi:prophage DNA circulation protein
MSWRDRLQKSSFKSVQLYWSDIVYTKGRRVPVRKLAGQDESVQQDLGRDPDTIEVTAYYFGDSFDQQRDALEDALVKEGGGTFVHPTRGQINCRVTSGPVTTESKDGLGFCTIRFSLVVEPRKGGGASSKTGGLQATTSTAAKLKSASKATQAVAGKDPAKNVNIRGLPSAAIKSTTKAIGAVTSTLKSVQREIQAQLNVVEDLSAQINELDSVVNTIMSTPSALATKLTAVVLGVVGLADTAERNIDRTTGLLISDSVVTPFEKASPARVTLRAVKAMALLGTDAATTTSNGTSVGAGTTPPAAASRVDAGTTSGAIIPTPATLPTDGSVVTVETLIPGIDDGEAFALTFQPERSDLTVGDQEAVNTRSIYQDAKALTVARAAETFATATFDSSTLALGALETMNDVIDALQEYSGSDELSESLADLRGALADHLTAVASKLPSTQTFSPTGIVSGADERKGAVVVVGQSTDPLDATTTRKGNGRRSGLPRVVQYDPPQSVPAVLIAWELYGDAELEEDIIARNGTRHPLFVSEPIELIEP